MINAVTSDTTTAAAAMKKATGMNKDDFLNLFITQLKNQDPLKPQDSSEFITQLSQLTQVEQSYNTNTNLTSILSAMNGATNMSAVSFIGKDVTANGGTVNLTSGTAQTLGVRLPAQANQVNVDIKDGSGSTVRTLTAGLTSAGDSTVQWDGRDNSNRQLPSGSYTYTVTGVGADGNKFSGTSLMVGRVDGVNLEGKEPVLKVGGLDIPLSNILAVKGVI